jgi:hypothetical protein
MDAALTKAGVWSLANDRRASNFATEKVKSEVAKSGI